MANLDQPIAEDVGFTCEKAKLGRGKGRRAFKKKGKAKKGKRASRQKDQSDFSNPKEFRNWRLRGDGAKKEVVTRSTDHRRKQKKKKNRHPKGRPRRPLRGKKGINETLEPRDKIWAREGEPLSTSRLGKKRVPEWTPCAEGKKKGGGGDSETGGKTTGTYGWLQLRSRSVQPKESLPTRGLRNEFGQRDRESGPDALSKEAREKGDPPCISHPKTKRGRATWRFRFRPGGERPGADRGKEDKLDLFRHRERGGIPQEGREQPHCKRKLRAGEKTIKKNYSF